MRFGDKFNLVAVAVAIDKQSVAAQCRFNIVGGIGMEVSRRFVDTAQYRRCCDITEL